MELPQLNNYTQLFLNDIPLIDVRAPLEFEQGAFPRATNLPLMNNDERHQVGLRYKQQGQQSAIDLGHELVSNAIRKQRIAAWQQFSEQHPNGALYCFRGGLRSRISQQWIFEHTGTLYPRIEGGYKAMRHFLLQEIEQFSQHIQPLILGGRTGSGKTLLLDRLGHKLDLEKIFQHRGSAFGRFAKPQPSQIDVENQLAIQILKQRHQQRKTLLLEDEAANIGSRRLPLPLFECMKQAPLVVLLEENEQRVENIFHEYITQSLLDYQRHYGEQPGFSVWSENLLNSLTKVQRRLGGERFRQAMQLMQHALSLHQSHNRLDAHRQWIEYILHEYYDPMYDYQISQKAHRIVFQGTAEDILDYIKQNYNLI